ncbi:MAG TPA: CMD domain protein [Stellaceae bacterium]|nr:CMD domain protein [Stellaceae bacterium]
MADAKSGGTDIVDMLLGIEPGSALAALRAERPEVLRHTRQSYEALFEPASTGGLSRLDRGAAALRVARLNEDAPLATHFRHYLAGITDGDAFIDAVERFPEMVSTKRLEAILLHVDRVTRTPAMATPAHLAELQSAGLAPTDIVTLSQLIAFVTYLTRAVAGLRLLGSAA